MFSKLKQVKIKVSIIWDNLILSQAAREAALAEEAKWSEIMPPYPGLKRRAPSVSRQLSDLSTNSEDARSDDPEEFEI